MPGIYITWARMVTYGVPRWHVAERRPVGDLKWWLLQASLVQMVFYTTLTKVEMWLDLQWLVDVGKTP